MYRKPNCATWPYNQPCIQLELSRRLLALAAVTLRSVIDPLECWRSFVHAQAQVQAMVIASDVRSQGATPSL